jgi:hypothetical protein
MTVPMMVTIWNDNGFQYTALYRSFLPKLAVALDGVETGSSEMITILEQHEIAAANYLGWPRKAAVTILVSLILYFSSFALSVTRLSYGDDGKESLLMIVLRVSSLFLVVIGVCVFFHRNIEWVRFKYTFESTQGILWMIYAMCYGCAGLAGPDPKAPVNYPVGIIMTTFVLFFWLAFESVRSISRLMHTTITVMITITMLMGIYCSAFVWQDDVELADLNGPLTEGVLTRYDVQRTCLVNLVILMMSALKTSFEKNIFAGNKYFGKSIHCSRPVVSSTA